MYLLKYMLLFQNVKCQEFFLALGRLSRILTFLIYYRATISSSASTGHVYLSPGGRQKHQNHKRPRENLHGCNRPVRDKKMAIKHATAASVYASCQRYTEACCCWICGSYPRANNSLPTRETFYTHHPAKHK